MTQPKVKGTMIPIGSSDEDLDEIVAMLTSDDDTGDGDTADTDDSEAGE